MDAAFMGLTSCIRVTIDSTLALGIGACRRVGRGARGGVRGHVSARSIRLTWIAGRQVCLAGVADGRLKARDAAIRDPSQLAGVWQVSSRWQRWPVQAVGYSHSRPLLSGRSRRWPDHGAGCGHSRPLNRARPSTGRAFNGRPLATTPVDAGPRRRIVPVPREKTHRNRTVSNTIYCGNIRSIRFICIPQGHKPTPPTTT